MGSLLVLAAWIFRTWRVRPEPGAKAGRDWVFAGLVLLLLFAWRWPYLLCASEYNPDESQFIAGAMALKHDPVFWRSVDGATAGPLDFYVLLPLHWLGLPLDYFSLRVTTLLLTWLLLLLPLRLLRSAVSPVMTQLAILPCAVFFAIATDADFVHGASELLPSALLALALCWTGTRPRLAAFVAGCPPWAKLQAIPLSAVLIAWQLAQAWREARREGTSPWRRCAGLLGWALAPSLLTLAGLAATGQLEHFFRRYLLQNFAYVGQGQPLAAVWHELVRRSQDSGHFTVWSLAALLLLLASVAGYLLRRQRPSAPFWLGAGLLATAIICIAVPARTTLHYVLLVMVPVILCTGAALRDLWPHAGVRRALIGLILAGVLLALGLRLQQPVPAMFGQFAEHWRHPHTSLGTVLRHWKRPGTRLALWGWRSSLYVESGIPQATRDTVSGWCIVDTPQRDYYRATFLADMVRNRPELFVDGVGVDATAFSQRSTQGHEKFPALADYVRRHYRLVSDLQGPRVYVRTDFLAQHPLTSADLEQLIARGRVDYIDPFVPVALKTYHARIGGRLVQMIEPPAELQWFLTGAERSLRLDFGFHPKAYTEGDTDGAELIAELRMPGQPPVEIYQRFLDPRQAPADRGPQSAEIVLPPFPPGTTLVVRTAPGKWGNGAWDWVYFSELRFARSPFYSPRQFPGFRRVPDRVAAVYPYIVHHETESLLMLPPPTSLTFVLDGSEQQLEFAYGLLEGAYTGSGRTDGAIYQVTLQQGQAPARIIFERRLDPLNTAADRGRQHTGLALPDDIQAGDRLVLRIDAGTNSSWDWTYVSELELR